MPPLGCSTVKALQPVLNIPPFSHAISSSVSPRTYVSHGAEGGATKRERKTLLDEYTTASSPYRFVTVMSYYTPHTRNPIALLQQLASSHLRVVEVKHGYPTGHRRRDHVGRVEPSAHAYFDNADVYAFAHEAPKPHLFEHRLH